MKHGLISKYDKKGMTTSKKVDSDVITVKYDVLYEYFVGCASRARHLADHDIVH